MFDAQAGFSYCSLLAGFRNPGMIVAVLAAAVTVCGASSLQAPPMLIRQLASTRQPGLVVAQSPTTIEFVCDGGPTGTYEGYVHHSAAASLGARPQPPPSQCTAGVPYAV